MRGAILGGDRTAAVRILKALLPGFVPEELGLDNAIRVELLITALQDAEYPRTVADLHSVLERISAGAVATEVVSAVRELAKRDPGLLLADLGRAA
jgi:hypothetical protein